MDLQTGVEILETSEKVREMKLKYRNYMRDYMRKYRQDPEKRQKMYEADKRRWARILKESKDNG